MFDLLRNLTKSDVEKQQEALNAYLDNALTSQEEQRFEQRLAQDTALQAQVAQLRILKQQMRRLPQRRVPRNFMLDPQKYGRPQTAPLIRAYPILRTATALTAVFFVIALAANVFLSDFSGGNATEAVSAPIAMNSMAEESEATALPAAETVIEESAAYAVEITRVVTEEILETTAAEEMVVEEMVMEEAAEAEEPPSEASAIDTRKEGVPAAPEMPLDVTGMIAGTAEFKETDLAAADGLELPAADESAIEVGTSLAIPQEAATIITERATVDETNDEAADSDIKRDMPEEVPAQADQPQLFIDPWFVAVVILGVLLLMLLILTWSTRRRL